MRTWMVIVGLMVPAVARAQVDEPPPPSATLVRALKLYEQEDYLSATIELRKVLDGDAGDAPEGLQRAQFFLAKSIYQLGLYAASLSVFQAIQADDAHLYHGVTLKWLLGLARVLPERSGILEHIAPYASDTDARSMIGDLGDELELLVGARALANGDFEEALDHLHLVPEGSLSWAAAQRAIGEALFRLGDVDRGVEAMAAATGDVAVASIAVRELVMWTRLLGDPPAASDALTAIAGDGGPAAPFATYAGSRIAHEIPALRGLTDTFDALALTVTCGQGHVDDAIGAMQPLAKQVREALGALLRYEDNAELFAAARTASLADTPVGHAIRLSLGRAEPMYWAAELATELELYGKMDAAWRSTAVAADVEAELQLEAALAEADAGRWLRDWLSAIQVDLGRLAGVDVTLSADATGDGLVIPAALCKEAGLSSAAPPLVPEPPSPPPAPRAHGCAGCASSSPSGGLVLLLATLAASRARRRRPR